jgi:hypothetical protein
MDYSKKINLIENKYSKLKKKYIKDISILKQEIKFLSDELNNKCTLNYKTDMFLSTRKVVRLGVYVDYL